MNTIGNPQPVTPVPNKRADGVVRAKRVYRSNRYSDSKNPQKQHPKGRQQGGAIDEYA